MEFLSIWEQFVALIQLSGIAHLHSKFLDEVVKSRSHTFSQLTRCYIHARASVLKMNGSTVAERAKMHQWSISRLLNPSDPGTIADWGSITALLIAVRMELAEIEYYSEMYTVALASGEAVRKRLQTPVTSTMPAVAPSHKSNRFPRNVGSAHSTGPHSEALQLPEEEARQMRAFLNRQGKVLDQSHRS